jgi:hypothetical protein
MTALEPVAAILDRHSVPYALIGAAALAVRGVARSTFDIDLLTTDARVFDAAIWATLSSEVDIRRGDAEDPLAGVIRVASDHDRPVDIVVGRHAWQARAVERAEPVGDSSLKVVLARDLVLLKLYAGGAQDMWDVRELLQHSPASLVEEVEADLAAGLPDMRERWRSLHN